MTTTGPETRVERTRAELSYGLGKWVEDYQAARLAGNVSLAREAKANIEERVEALDLDRDTVYGLDANRPRVPDTFGWGLGHW